MERKDLVFETVGDAITYAFRHEQTLLLSLDRICQILLQPNMSIRHKQDGSETPCSTITRRRISSTLSSSEIFTRAGPARTCVWALRPGNPLCLSDAALSASIDQILAENGPVTSDDFGRLTDLSSADSFIYERYLVDHESDYSRGNDGTYWFAGQPRPSRANYESITRALVNAFNQFPQGASVEQLHWFLCLSTVGGSKQVTRRSVSRELSRRSDKFVHLSRSWYKLLRRREEPSIETVNLIRQVYRVALPAPVIGFQFVQAVPRVEMSPEEVHRTLQEDEDFNPFSFFGNDFTFAYE